ncbi:MAG: c-type cytochrome [Gammaproteobacteria bacterium]|nr:c-type cytochrome [Gammaproteobacteria bacterium]
MKKSFFAGIACLAISLTNPVFAANDAAAGQAKSALCAGCHSADGNSMVPMFPKLAGQHSGYLAKQLADFKAGTVRSDPTMAGMVAGLSEEDMSDLAAYFAAQTATPGAASDAAKAAAGETIFRGGITDIGVPACAGCHSPTGHGNPAAHFPSLAGQHAAYIIKQLTDFKAGTRSNDAGKMMRNVAKHMTSEQIAQVAEYISGLQ